MCGFIGALSRTTFSSPHEVKSYLDGASDMLMHRGPDMCGAFMNEWLGFVFRRLAIIDLDERANQPLFDAAKRYAIVYNGELYNYRELKEELTRLGCSFVTTSDTEVVLQAFMQWGTACVERFMGMYAFMIADIESENVTIARDPYGIKPLYYCEHDNAYYFASEIKALLPLSKSSLNADMLYEYFAFRYSVSDETIIKNIYRVQPGAIVIFTRLGKLEQYTAYNLFTQPIATEKRYNSGHVHAMLEEGLRSSVALHTRCDVDYGVQLSGGIDSSLVVKYAAELHEGRLHSFSVSFDETECNEYQYQQEVATRCHTIHHDIRLSESLFLDTIEKAVWYFDMPLHDPNDVAFYLLCEAAQKQGLKVILSGDGADELFYGYSRYVSLLKRKEKGIAWHARACWADTLFSLSPLVQHYVSRLSKKLFPRHPIIHLTTMNDPVLVHTLFPKLAMNIKKRFQIYKTASRDPLQARANLDCCAYLRPWLTRADRMGMAASVELRVPFCNPALLSLVRSLPREYMFSQEHTKYALKKIAEQYFSHALVWRRKVGFGLPLDTWFRNKKGLGGYFAHYVLSRDAVVATMVDHDALEKIIAEHDEHQVNHSRLLWNILAFELWHKKYLKN